jgi:hypothetical protein
MKKTEKTETVRRIENNARMTQEGEGERVVGQCL